MLDQLVTEKSSSLALRITTEQILANDEGLDFDYDSRYARELVKENWSSFGFFLCFDVCKQYEVDLCGEKSSIIGAYLDEEYYVWNCKEGSFICPNNDVHIFHSLDQIIRLKLGLNYEQTYEAEYGVKMNSYIIFESNIINSTSI